MKRSKNIKSDQPTEDTEPGQQNTMDGCTEDQQAERFFYPPSDPTEKQDTKDVETKCSSCAEMSKRLQQLQHQLKACQHHIARLSTLKPSMTTTGTQTTETIPACEPFTTESIRKSPVKNLFSYYTGLEYTFFVALFTFLFPNNCSSVTYQEKRKEINKISDQDKLLLVLCRLRNGLHVKDLAFRFSISVQTVSVIFNSLISFMYTRLGYLSYWPGRETIIEKMPTKYKQDFPTTLAIIDCTELKCEKPSGLKLQSQCYSDYKSTTTFKSLIAVDPLGSVLFVSSLFSGSISDNDICKNSGFFDLLISLKEKGFVKDGDCIMADKGFRIEKQLAELGLKLNVPPLASSHAQMSPEDVSMTKKIATHRIHVERKIRQVKSFKLVGRKIPLSMSHNINEIWFVCCKLTNFQPTLVKC